MVTEYQGLDLEALEGMVDRHGLPGLLEMLASIASDKAEHVAVNWQDATTAKVWERDASALSHLAEKLEEGVS